MQGKRFMDRHFLLAGSTGLVGSEVFFRIVSDENHSELWVPTRNISPSHQTAATDKTHFLEMDNLFDIKPEDIHGQITTYICCLGTTMKRAGGKDPFYRIDHDLTMHLGKVALQRGAREAILVSAADANSKSPFFYNMVKGKTEEDLAELGFESLHIMQPSILIGPRNEHRPFEAACQRIWPHLDALLPMKYRSMPSAVLAQAIQAICSAPPAQGVRRYKYHAIMQLAGKDA
jgi:uncharacterized protein YbjT (DUF2867 family)